MIVTKLSDVPGKPRNWRKKPVVIRAVELTERVRIKTREGELTGEPGDFLIEGVRKEIYPVAGDIFKETYDLIRLNECIYCGKELIGAHPNRRFCSDKCVYKNNYRIYGQRYSPERRREQYSERMKKEECREKTRVQGRLSHERVRQYINSYKLEKGCADCGYRKEAVALDFDHVDGEKELNVCFSKSIAQAKKEIAKCEVVCACCHRIRTITRLKKGVRGK